MNLLSSIGKAGESQGFIAWNAHMFFAAFVVLACGRYAVAGACVFFIASAIKEFWFDLRYETAPPQTLTDSAIDFAGYLSGLVLGCVWVLVV